MHEDFDEDEHQTVEQQRDTELTLGPALLLGLFFGLVLLCGLCFGLGYSMGSHSTQIASATGQPGAGGTSVAAGSLLKPSAVAQNIQTPRAVTDLPVPDTSGVNQGAGSQNPNPDFAAGAKSTPPTVKPALPVAATTPTHTSQAPMSASAQPAPALPAPATKYASTAPASGMMVQIATVSHQEDADVLVGALRKRGYAVTVHRASTDNQFHVQVGPFASRNDASAMRQKLLNDGYNAILQP